MIEGEPQPQEIVLTIRFSQKIGRNKSRQTVLLFEGKNGRLALPSIKDKYGDEILEEFDKKYGLAITNRGITKIVDRNKEGINVIVLDFIGIMAPIRGNDKFKPHFFPYDDLEEILKGNKLTKVTQKVLILFLTKLALRGRLC